MGIARRAWRVARRARGRAGPVRIFGIRSGLGEFPAQRARPSHGVHEVLHAVHGAMHRPMHTPAIPLVSSCVLDSGLSHLPSWLEWTVQVRVPLNRVQKHGCYILSSLKEFRPKIQNVNVPLKQFGIALPN